MHEFKSTLCSSLDIDIQIYITETDEQRAWWIRFLGDKHASKYDHSSRSKPSAYPSRQIWETRKWLCPNESRQERFLASFPTINVFHAQIILCHCTLAEFLGMRLDQMVEMFGLWVPERNLRMFHYMIHIQLDGQ